MPYKLADLDLQNVANSGKRLNSFWKLCSTSRKELTNYQSRTWGNDLGFFFLQKKASPNSFLPPQREEERKRSEGKRKNPFSINLFFSDDDPSFPLDLRTMEATHDHRSEEREKSGEQEKIPLSISPFLSLPSRLSHQLSRNNTEIIPKLTDVEFTDLLRVELSHTSNT